MYCISLQTKFVLALANFEIRAAIQSNPSWNLPFLFFQFTFNTSGNLPRSTLSEAGFFVFSGLRKSTSCNVQIGVLFCTRMLEGRFDKLGSLTEKHRGARPFPDQTKKKKAIPVLFFLVTNAKLSIFQLSNDSVTTLCPFCFWDVCGNTARCTRN